MNNIRFWESKQEIISEGFTQKGIEKLEHYGELFCSRRLIFKRFSPQEQHGCATGGPIHVVATILTGAEAPADSIPEKISGLQRELKCAAYQASTIEHWAKAVGVWIDNVENYLNDRFGVNIA